MPFPHAPIRRFAALGTASVMLGAGLLVAAPATQAAPVQELPVSAAAAKTVHAKPAVKKVKKALTRRAKLTLRGQRVVAYAKSKINASYVAGASGPNAFDCSGFALAAWRTAGANLPHYSRSQFGVTKRVKPGRLLPGDLLFYFGNGAHHVAIYIGGGRMIGAANPSSDIQINNVGDSWYASRYSGAGRVVTAL